MRLAESGIKLTEREQKVLQAIRDEGSFFEEAGGNESVANYGGTFFGWEINDGDVHNEFHVNGVVSSLVKKGVLDVQYDSAYDDMAAYYINYELDFAEDDPYRIVF